MDAIAITLAVAAFVAGLTGTWSPCGFSMIETIGPAGHTGGLRTTAAACVAFAIGCVAGGIVTFGSLAALGGIAHGADERLAYAAAAVIAIAAAVADARGMPIAPQIRRQLPEHWRRLMPMPLAAGLYGVLLGVGFTTFVLSFGVFALAGVSFAVGEPATGLAVGIAFGVGRALPVVAVAPLADRPAGCRITEAMAERPALYRGLRLGDALALVAVAAVLVVTVPASASSVREREAADPSTNGAVFVYQRPDRSGVAEAGGAQVGLPGRDPAVGDDRIAYLEGGQIVVARSEGGAELARIQAADADAVAISSRWVAWRARKKRRDSIYAVGLADPSSPGRRRAIARVGRNAQLGRPSLDGSRLVYAHATKRRNRIVLRRLGRKAGGRTLLASRRVGLSNPSILGKRLLYVRHTRRRDHLKLTGVRRPRKGKTLLAKRGGTLWSTALDRRRAYVTHIRGTRPRQKILSAGR